MHDFNHFYNANAVLWLTSIVINLSGDELMLGDVANPREEGGRGKGKGEGGMGNGEWGMGNGEWGMGKGERGKGKGKR
ncbi:MAG: hypothetical protein KME31_19885 [Tolypothrix carrinoi HA7290-LM1]|jgi:hypothetical protein|nr:hypothetical protein [Tolypothrix carrinoi HA7290-LM1]